jgi:hypothetical protein
MYILCGAAIGSLANSSRVRLMDHAWYVGVVSLDTKFRPGGPEPGTRAATHGHEVARGRAAADQHDTPRWARVPVLDQSHRAVQGKGQLLYMVNRMYTEASANLQQYDLFRYHESDNAHFC